MNIAAYCRVSTDKTDQLNSLEAQKEFLSEYIKCTLARLYADEGISGTKIKNRKEFLRMMSDAEYGLFDMGVVKDRRLKWTKVGKDGNVDIFQRLFGDIGLDESVPKEDNENVLNRNGHT